MRSKIGSLKHIAFVAMLLAALSGQSPDEQSFQNFLKWLAARPPASRPTDLVPPYRQELIKQASTQEADRQLAKLWQRAYHDPEGARILWNKLYTAKMRRFSRPAQAHC